MGSLMAGWDSISLDAESASLERNHSLTNEEITAYWRTQKKIEEEHLRAISKLSDTIQTGKLENAKNSHDSSTVPLARIKDSLGMNVDPKSLEQLMKKNGWWTKSNLAFLNEPPLIEAATNKYASQFHVANLASSKINPGDGIGA